MNKDTTFLPFTIKCRKKMHTFSRPVVMGILNVTSDSFFDGGRYGDEKSVLDRVGQMLSEGADIIDIGAVSTRPGGQLLPPDEEAARLVPVVSCVRNRYPDALISVDTCYSVPASAAVEAGADIVNDISGGQFDEAMFPTIARLQVPYVLTHTRGTPDRMLDNVLYDSLFQEVCLYFSERLEQLCRLGVSDVVIDPGFGFAKGLDDNYGLFAQMGELRQLFPRNPLLVGVSRKSMIYKLLETDPQGALAGTVALNAQALALGAQILRVHDVRETVQTVKILCKLWNS